MTIDIFSFASGFLVAIVFCTIIIAIAFEIRKKRALAFTKRFAVISEGLSSLKALSHRIVAQLRRLQHHYQGDEVNSTDLQKIKSNVDALIYIFDTISAGMMPPTEEIAMEALEGRSTTAEQRAYEDSVKFRDDVRKIRKSIEKNGLEGLANEADVTHPAQV